MSGIGMNWSLSSPRSESCEQVSFGMPWKAPYTSCVCAEQWVSWAFCSRHAAPRGHCARKEVQWPPWAHPHVLSSVISATTQAGRLQNTATSTFSLLEDEGVESSLFALRKHLFLSWPTWHDTDENFCKSYRFPSKETFVANPCLQAAHLKGKRGNEGRRYWKSPVRTFAPNPHSCTHRAGMKQCWTTVGRRGGELVTG